MSTATANNHSVAIWERLVHPSNATFSPEVAHYYLGLEFSEMDQARVQDLSAKAREGTLTPEEERELDEYLSINSLLISLKAKARISLRNVAPTA